PQHLRRLQGAGPSRSARVGLVLVRQHRRRRSVQRLARPARHQRVADDRLEQRPGDDAPRNAGRVRSRHVRHLVAGLFDVHRRDAQRHQSALRDVGNGGSPEVVDRTLSPNETERTWYRQNPPLAHVKWDLRDNNNYEQTGILVSLSYVANNRVQLLRNFYEKSKRSIEKPKTEGPAAYVLSAADPRLGSQAELLHVLQRQRVEISRATQAFTVTMPARRATLAAGRGRAGRGGNANGGNGGNTG